MARGGCWTIAVHATGTKISRQSRKQRGQSEAAEVGLHINQKDALEPVLC